MRESVTPGTTVYAEVVFSSDIELPWIFFWYPGMSYAENYRIVPRGSSGSAFQSGDAKPVRGNSVYLCKTAIPESLIGSFHIYVNGKILPESLQIALPMEPLPFRPKYKHKAG